MDEGFLVHPYQPAYLRGITATADVCSRELVHRQSQGVLRRVDAGASLSHGMAQGRVRWIVHVPGHDVDVQYRPLGDRHENVPHRPRGAGGHRRRGPVIVRMGCLQNIGNPRGVLQCPDDDCAPVGSVQVLGQPAQTGTVPGEQDGASAGMAVECIFQVHGTPDTITDNIETGPEPLDLRRFRCS